MKTVSIFAALACVGMLVWGSSLSAADEGAKKDNFIVTSKTKHDFGEAAIDGQMQAPQGFFLQGRNQQTLSQMVKLRAHFKNELRNSKSAVKAISK